MTHEEWALTLAYLRFGGDTKSARLLKELLRETPDAQLLDRLMDALWIPPEARAACVRTAADLARRAVRDGQAARLEPMAWDDARMSPLLRQIPDPPIVLWCGGDQRCLAVPAVAVVGSRRATAAGLSIARRLACELAAAGLVVVSGLARGVDAAAHEGALAGGGRTIAVLGSGADVIYPGEHTRLAERIRGSGAIVSEFAPGTPPLPHHFPLRNRIISGLSRAVVLIEASDRSGSLITARAALEQGRDVLVVPGNAVSGQYAGSHALIKDGAPLVETVQDVLDVLQWTPPDRRVAAAPGVKSHEINGLEADLPEGEPMTIDELAARTGLPAAALLAELSRLELAGKIVRVPGGGFVKVDNSAIGGRNG